MQSSLDFFDIYEYFGSLIINKLEDPRKDRPKGAWVKPTFSESNNNFPMIIINVNNPSYTYSSASDVFCFETAVDGTYKEYYYREAESNIKFTVLSQKDREYNIVINGEKLFLKGQKLNVYLAKEIINIIRYAEKTTEFTSIFDFIDHNTMDIAFENDKNTWGSILDYNLKYKNIWCREYTTIGGQLISDYSLNVALMTEE